MNEKRCILSRITDITKRIHGVMIQYGNMGSSWNDLVPWTQQINSYTWNKFLWKKSRKEPRDSYTLCKWKHTYMDMGRKGWDTLLPKTLPPVQWYTVRRRHTQLSASPWSQQVPSPHSPSGPLKAEPVFNIVPQDYNKQMVINWLSPRAQHRGNRQMWPFSSLPLKQVYFYTSKTAAWGSGLQSACI